MVDSRGDEVICWFNLSRSSCWSKINKCDSDSVTNTSLEKNKSKKKPGGGLDILSRPVTASDFLFGDGGFKSDGVYLVLFGGFLGR